METLDSFSPEVIKNLVDQIEFFNVFSSEEVEYVLKFMDQFIRFRPEEVLLHEQQSDDFAMYVLLLGKCVITSGQQNVYLGEVIPGQFFGEISFMLEKPRSANVIAIEPSIVWRIDHDLINSCPLTIKDKLYKKVIDKLARVIYDGNDKLVDSFT